MEVDEEIGGFFVGLDPGLDCIAVALRGLVVVVSVAECETCDGDHLVLFEGHLEDAGQTLESADAVSEREVQRVCGVAVAVGKYKGEARGGFCHLAVRPPPDDSAHAVVMHHLGVVRGELESGFLERRVGEHINSSVRRLRSN